MEARKEPAAKMASDCGVNSIQNIPSVPSDEKTTLYRMTDLLMGLVQETAPVVKTLREAHEASLLCNNDEDAQAKSTSHNGEHEVDECQSKPPKSDLARQPSTPKSEQSTADPSSKVYSLEVLGLGISEKIASVLKNILASGLNEQATKKWKENIHRPSKRKLIAQTCVNPEIYDIAKKALLCVLTNGVGMKLMPL